MKTGMLIIGSVAVCLFLTGCIEYNKGDDKVFEDCGSFLSYYDSCTDFMDSIPGSVCEKYDSLDIPKSDEACYPIVECDWFMKRPETATRLVDCRYEDRTPKCVLSFDISCEDFSVSDTGVTLFVKNKGDVAVKNIQLSILGDARYECLDSQGDSRLEPGETDTFVCNGVTSGGTLSLVYADGMTGAINTKDGELVI